MAEDYDVAEHLDGVKLDDAATERERAKGWCRTAGQHCRNEEYWRKRALAAEAQAVNALYWRQRCEKSETPPAPQDPCGRSIHQRRVDAFSAGIGRPLPLTPTAPDPDNNLLWARLLLEEVWETVTEGQGFDIVHNGESLDWKDLQLLHARDLDLVLVADGCADVRVIATGLLSICGISDEHLQKEVDDNNLLKLKTGKIDPVTRKFMKSPNHPKPDIKGILVKQGMKPKCKETEDGPGVCSQGCGHR